MTSPPGAAPAGDRRRRAEGPLLSPEVRALAKAVCGAGRRLVADGLAIGTAGNISARDPFSGLIAVTPSRIPYDQLEPTDISIVDHFGRVVHSVHRPTSELALHVSVLGRGPHVNAVVHTHSPYATAFSVARRSIPLICNEGLGVGAATVEVTDYAPPGTKELGLAAVALLDQHPSAFAFLLANHGLVALGEDLDAAYLLAAQVEWEARIYHLSLQLGEPHVLDGELMRHIVETYSALPDLELSAWPDLP